MQEPSSPRKPSGLLGSPELLRRALWDAVRKLNPAEQWRNPTMLVVLRGAAAATADLFYNYSLFVLQVAVWLWFTVYFANFAEALAEGRGKAQAETLRRMRTQASARKLQGGREVQVLAAELKFGDLCVCETGDIIPGDGEVVEGIATVDESAITGESAPVVRESGGDRSAVTGGTRVISDRIVIRIMAEAGHSFLDRMIRMIEGARRQRTPNEIALNIVLTGQTLLYIVSTAVLPAYGAYSEAAAGQPGAIHLSITILAALTVCLIPTTIGGLLSAIGISGIDRLMRRNILAMSGRAVEAAGDIDLLLLDKTGTITLGNRMATDFLAAPGVAERELADAAQLASLADETPEGRSITVLAKERYGLRGRPVAEQQARFVPFTAQTRMSGVDLESAEGFRRIRKGAAEAVRHFVENQGGVYPMTVAATAETIAKSGGTPIVVADSGRVLGVIHLKDVVKGGIRERFDHLRRMGIRTVMITGDNPLTAAAIAAEAGVDDFMAEAKPEAKLERIRREQAGGHLVAMIGDGTNDAPALAQSDVGVAMHSGTQAAREAGNMLDLESNPTKLLEIVEIGKQILMTRGALTTLSFATDLAKYFAILPAVFGTIYAVAPGEPGPLAVLNVMRLHSPQSAILAAVIFNALIITALIPLAIKGVRYRSEGAAAVLRRNLLFYGLGGLALPFAGIKLIDMLLVLLGAV